MRWIPISKLILLVAATATLAACNNGMKAKSSAEDSASAVPTRQFTLGALGDSISRGMDIQVLGLESVDESWTTGTLLSGSIVNRIQSELGFDYSVHGLNNAVSGQSVLGSASLFSSDAVQLAALSPDVVTVEIGANDVCQGHLTGTGQSQMRDKVIAVLNTLKSAPNPPKRIVVTSIPHIFQLTQLTGFAGSTVCQTAWNLMCPNLSIGITAFETQWAAANQALDDAVASSGGQVVFDGGAVAGVNFMVSDVSSIDCFHPSVQGQNRLAAVIWPFVQGALAP